MSWVNVGVAVGGAVLGKREKDKANKRANTDMASVRTLEDRELALAEQQDARSAELFKHYSETFLPKERAFVERAFGDELSPARSGARATADVRSAVANSRAISGRNLRRLGVNPASGPYAAVERGLMLDEAALESGAVTRAREGTRDRNFARQYDALSLGRGLPSTSSSMLSAAQSGVGSAASLAGSRSRFSTALADQSGEDFGAMLAEAAASIYDIYNSRPGKGKTAPKAKGL